MMISFLDLGGVWKVRGFDGQHGSPEVFVGAGVDERTFIDAQVPGEIHLDLERAGWIEDSNIEMNAQRNRWVEEQVWLYRRTFQAPEDARSRRVWLAFDGLDLNAVVYLNGEVVGRHSNVFTPCRFEVTGRLQPENQLSVVIESGLYGVAEKPSEAYSPALDHKLHKRAWLRKPQNQFSWDWSPRLVNVGIWKDVRLEWTDTARIDQLAVYPELAGDHASAVLRVRAFVENVGQPGAKAVLKANCPEAGVSEEVEVELPEGVSRQDIALNIDNPRLWWPRPMGEQPLYTVNVELCAGGSVVDSATRRTGIRSVRINQDPHPVEGDYFIIEVNGKPVFAKGGNWVPADLIFARVTPERYRKLVELAVEANCNALRIWGGGLYADHALLDACDELGVLVWHDFIFACSKYPGDDPEFLGKVRSEVTYQTRELSPHPSLLVWCGNNELEWGAWEWGYDKVKAHPDLALFHIEIPRILNREDPSRPYWPSSPYSTDFRHPTLHTTGDQHPWGVSLQGDGPNFWAYRNYISRFPNEGGVLGASSMATLRQFLPEDQRQLFSPTWEFHDNACNYWGDGGICYRFFEHWLGVKADAVDFEDYVFYSGLIQAEGLKEYSDNFRRRKWSSSSAIFWMYNDCWPASHGWTIVDYYLRRKPAYHPVRRAFAPVHIIPVVEDGMVRWFGVNDTREDWTGQARMGLFLLAGGLPVDETRDVTLKANESTLLAERPLAEWEALGTRTSGAFGVLLQSGAPVAQNRIFIAPYKDLEFTPAQVSVERKGGKAVFSSPAFVWGVSLDADGEAPVSDDLFDLLPGIDYVMEWPEDTPLPEAQRFGSDLPWK